MEESTQEEEYLYLENALHSFSKIAGFEISVRSFMEWVEGRKDIRLYWQLNNMPARKVQRAPTSSKPIPVPFQSLNPQSRLAKKLGKSPIIREATSWASPEKIVFAVNEFPLTPNTIAYTLYKPEGSKATLIRDLVALEFDNYNLIMTDWLHSKATGLSQQALSLDGVIVSSSKGLWQIIECHNGIVYSTSAFPSVSELKITKKAFLEYAQYFASKSDGVTLGGIERTNLLRLVGALLVLLTKSTRDHCLEEKIIKAGSIEGIKPPLYRIEDQIILVLAQMFPSIAGLKKSTLTTKFGEAKKALGLKGDWDFDDK